MVPGTRPDPPAVRGECRRTPGEATGDCRLGETFKSEGKKMRKMAILAAGLAAVAVMAMPAWTPASAASTQDIINGCESCHGPKGASTHKDIPIIGGVSAFYIDAQIQAYQKKLRPCPDVKYPAGPDKGKTTNMCDEVKNLDKKQAQDVTDYFSKQPFVPAKQSFDAAKAKTGKQIHETYCSRCHSEGGSFAMDDAGILAGQWTPYLKEQFKDYQAGKRWMPEKMKPKIDQLDAKQIEDLLNYYASEGASK